MKYPNLKHLALRDNQFLEDQHIERLISILPNLVLLDVRGSSNVTERSAYFIRDYCRRKRRSIKFYFDGNRNEIVSDLRPFSTYPEKISREFDFMKNCFFKRFNELPVFMVPIDS